MGGGRVIEIHSRAEWDAQHKANAGKAVSGPGESIHDLVMPATLSPLCVVAPSAVTGCVMP
jgi:hypothetical protein